MGHSDAHETYQRNPDAPVGQRSRGAFERARAAAAAGNAGGDAAGTSKAAHPQPLRRTLRGSLVERDNDAEYLEFHWNPESYKIEKSATWAEGAVAGGHPTLQFTGTGLTKVSFSLLLNNIGQPHRVQLSVENSLQWLFDRLRARSDPLRASPDTASRNLPWLNLQDPKASKDPPVLVLFGVSGPFTCVLEDVSVTTVWQGTPPANARTGRSSISNVPFFRQTAIDSFQLAGATQAINVANELSKISRARVEIKLKEYANDPTTDSK